MAALDKTLLEKVVKEISEKENIINPKVDYQYATKNGDGYLGVINAFELKGDNKTISLIIKSAPTIAKIRNSTPIQKSFFTEIHFYDKIMSTYRSYQEKHGIKKPFNEVPKCLATNINDCEEFLVLENIKVEGYDLWDRKKGMNSEHVEFVFHEYGKFHAISLAMKKKDPEMHQGLIYDLPIPTVLNIFLGEDVMGALVVKQAKNLVGMLDPVVDEEILRKFAPNVEGLNGIIQELCQPDDFSAITHGDCWCNNMMFRYNENKLKPDSMRLIDFQLVQYVSPVIDLSYFFYVCASPELLDNVEHYLKIYHRSLSQRLVEFGCDPEEILPYSILYKKWIEKSRFGLFMSTFLFKLMLTDKEDAVNLTESSQSNDNPLDAFGYDVLDSMEVEYKKRAVAVLKHFCKFGFI